MDDEGYTMNGFKMQFRPNRRWAVAATLGSAAAVVAACLAIRGTFGPQSASAQAPARQFVPAQPAAQAGMQARPAAPVAARPAAPAAGQPAALAPVSAQPLPPNPTTLQVMAVVNGEKISRIELGRECIRRYGETVLESLVNRQLIADACAQRRVQITEQDVDAEIDRIASRFGLPRDRWLTLLQEERGFSEARYRREVVWPMLALRMLASDQLQVTEAELKQAFDSEFGPKVRARLIAVTSRQKADAARAQAVANPAKFGELSKQLTEDPGVASAYGVIPPIRKHLGDPGLEQAAFSLKAGEISQVVQVANLYYILKCEEQLPQQYIASQHLAEVQKRMADKIRENKLRVAASRFFDDMQKQAQVVNVMKDPAMRQQMPDVAALVSNRPITLAQLADECILRHGAEVLDGEINRKILQQELNRKRQVVDKPDIDAEIARAADSFGYTKQDGTPDVERWLKQITEQEGATVELYTFDAVWPSVALKKLVGEKVAVTQDDLQKGFESNYGERVEVLAVVLSDQRQAQKVWEMARNNPTDAFFADLAKQYSVEPSSRSNGGKVPPIQRHSGSPILEEEAFKLKAGELSGIVAVDNQFIILRCQGRTKPVQDDFAAVKDLLYKEIHEKKLRQLMTKEFDRLRETAQIDNFVAGTSQSGRSVKPGTALSPVAPAGGVGAQRLPGKVAPASAQTPRPVQPLR
jgi:parvulin-like peptidyl-prolyl isomerase